MARQKMYRRGKLIKSLASVEKLIKANKYMMFFDGGYGKWIPKHPGIIRSMTIHTVIGFINAKKLSFAIKQQGVTI